MKSIFIVIIFMTQLISYEVEIQIVFGKDKQFGKIETGDLKIGTTGIVIKILQNNSKVIIAYAEIVEKDKVSFYEFETLKQVNLPKGLWKPQNGDIIRFKENYERALIISKNFNSFVKIRKRFDQNWVNPDIFSANLDLLRHKKPLKIDFKNFCKEYSVGLIYIGFSDEVKKIDCLSLKVVESFNMKLDSKTTKKPFYSRIKEIRSNWFGNKDDIVDYEKYYQNLIN